MTTTVFVYTINKLGAPGKWSRYVFPFPVDYFAQRDNVLYIRSGDDVLRLDKDSIYDYDADPRKFAFDGVIWWPWLDDGTPGLDKMIDSVDVVGTGTPAVQLGYDQTQESLFTDPYTVPPITYPGAGVPFALSCPSYSVKITYPGPQKWKLQTVNVWLNDTSGRPS